MRAGARVALGLVGALLSTTFWFGFSPAGPSVAATARPTPTLSDLLGDPLASPTPTPSPSRSDKPEEQEKPNEGSPDEKDPVKKLQRRLKNPLGRPNKGGKRKTKGPVYIPSGPTYTTDAILRVALQMRGLGFARKVIDRRVWPPFIVAGRASWSNTWGAPRYGPRPKQIRRHEGQDVFCDMGAPVLAAEPGRIDFDRQRLGGLVARLHTSDGSYWYYAHLSGWSKEFDSGDRVQVGDVIGLCGNSGNAITTPPHVHFGWYAGAAQNPHDRLVSWLQTAETKSQRLITAVMEQRVEEIRVSTARHRFGDRFAPDRSPGPCDDVFLSQMLLQPATRTLGRVFLLVHRGVPAEMGCRPSRLLRIESQRSRAGGKPQRPAVGVEHGPATPLDALDI